MRMKRKIFALIAVMTLALATCSCGSDDTPEFYVQEHEPTVYEQKLIALIGGSDEDIMMADYKTGADVNCASIGYDLFEKGKLTKKNQEQVQGRLGEARSGMIGLSYGQKDGRIVIYPDDGSCWTTVADTPWRKDNLGGVSGSTKLVQEPVAIEKDKKIYFFCHIENSKSKIPGIAFDAMEEDLEELKDVDKAYAFYVIFKYSKDYE